MMVGQQQPLVSCIMPTYNRREFIPYAIHYFLQQPYKNKELIIIDDGTDTIQDLIPDHPAIRYYSLEKKITLGAKLNLACRYANGDIIVHWDDDDWYAPRRIQYQVDSLRDTGTDVCGINNLLYYDLRQKKAFQYIYPSNQRVWLLGSSLCYNKKLWHSTPFADIDVGMDGLFVWATAPERIRVLPDSSFAVHMIHDKNISPKQTGGSWWHTYPVEEIQNLMQGDWHLYANSDARAAVQQDINAIIRQPVASQRKTFQNIHACLVHENEDCIIDLVCNLHYHDPDSIILLYNGSDDPCLIPDDFPFDQFGAFAVPNPIPVKHGYLHEFAILTMQFALANFSFDAITIVDSDQLAIRSGYSEYLSAFLASQPAAGMLSSAPEKVGRENKVNYVALQAFKEYDLWKPFLNSFPDGEGKFVHWTFWPSTVFTHKAARDLVKLFRENRQLQQIIAQSKIWASEEVILPTLVRLLGYEIVSNPCSYDYVKYRATYSASDVDNALSKVDNFWVHPIQRRYDDPLRKRVRERFHQYVVTNKTEACEGVLPPDPLRVLLLNKIRRIKGWLSDREAELLIAFTHKACQELPSPHRIVEIGSYHGKATVLFGSVAKAFPEANVYAIDTHDGRLGAVDQGLQSYPPSFEAFKRNIENAGLCGVVHAIKDRSYNVRWKEPVSLLFIDGLHDYLNVSRDFRHFADWILPGGYVAFHDYAPYFPGVQAFVNELLATGVYQKINVVDSLVMLQKRQVN
jgi:glycosyltransferase involved in cell wall biosynthesis